MSIFHKIIFSIESLSMLPKGKFICMLKRKFCVASFRFLTIIIYNYNFVCFRCFYPLHLAFKALVSAKISIFPLKIRVKSSFSHLVFGRSVCRLSNYTAVFLPDVSEMAKSGKNPKCSFFLLQNLQWNQRMNSHEPCK